MSDNLKTANRTELVASKNVIEMLTVANEFCHFLENAETYGKHDVLSFIQKVSPLLYIKGALMPKVLEETTEANERFVNEEQWSEVYNCMKDKFGEDDVFFNTDVYNDENVLIKSSIAEHLADVYQDLKDFLMLYKKGLLPAQENAIQECVNLFERHWGIRIVAAQKAVHQVLFKDKLNDDNSEFYKGPELF
ncbi:MAG: DUF5063 domain-containing protein [Bacteroidetes bacterium]|nr:DUF5063 domain-containing protein [Bacteroidota bacterium]